MTQLFFLEVYDLARTAGWTSDAHFTPARLCFGAHALMENPHGLCADFTPHKPGAERSVRRRSFPHIRCHVQFVAPAPTRALLVAATNSTIAGKDLPTA